MRRRPAILISLILLLLIGGGGGLFNLHLRKHDAPPLQEIMSYFSASSSTIGEGWSFTAYESYVSGIHNPHPWLAALGYSRPHEETDLFYFLHEPTGERAQLYLVHVEKKIIEATFVADNPESALSLEQNVLRKFPHLVRRMLPSHVGGSGALSQ